MNKQSIFFTCIVAIVAFALMLMLIQFLAAKLKVKPKTDDVINMSYSIWVGSLLVSFSIFLKIALDLTENAIEIIIYSKTINNTFVAVMEKIAIFTGFSFLFTFLAYYTITQILNLLTGNRSDSIEMEKNNFGYFTIKGLTLVMLTLSLSTIFEHFLRWFMPAVGTPFYH